jgi:hypothetical protein
MSSTGNDGYAEVLAEAVRDQCRWLRGRGGRGGPLPVEEAVAALRGPLDQALRLGIVFDLPAIGKALSSATGDALSPEAATAGLVELFPAWRSLLPRQRDELAATFKEVAEVYPGLIVRECGITVPTRGPLPSSGDPAGHASPDLPDGSGPSASSPEPRKLTFAEIFELEINAWCYGLANFPGEMSIALVYSVLRELIPLFHAAVRHETVANLPLFGRMLTRVSDYKISPVEACFSTMVLYMNPFDDEGRWINTILATVTEVERVYPDAGLLTRLARKWRWEIEKRQQDRALAAQRTSQGASAAPGARAQPGPAPGAPVAGALAHDGSASQAPRMGPGVCAFCGTVCSPPFLRFADSSSVGGNCFAASVELPASSWSQPQSGPVVCTCCGQKADGLVLVVRPGFLCLFCSVSGLKLLAHYTKLPDAFCQGPAEWLGSNASPLARLVVLRHIGEAWGRAGDYGLEGTDALANWLVENLGYGPELPLGGSVRHATFDAILAVGRPLLPYLLAGHRPEDPHSYVNALLATGRIDPDDEGVERMFERASRDPRVSVRVGVVGALERNDSHWAQEQIRTMTDDLEPAVSGRARRLYRNLERRRAGVEL